ncbi:unnamed protein product [Brachionus calyciflorus]|uniref:Uncharacterized protein n=1 Tax=Brachionus calyciflorus TaxID=104777 RepID=A0A814NG10_9BILA|nr:unnamed protein product [Brachionus calyciflorus]
MESPNKPRHLKNTRFTKKKVERNDSSSGSEEDVEANKDKKNNVPCTSSTSSTCVDAPTDFLENFRLHIPNWAGLIQYRDLRNVTLTNTCTIDNFLFALWHLSKIKPDSFEETEPTQEIVGLKEIVKLIDIHKWNLAKEKWVNNFLKLSESPINKTISLFGSEKNFFLNPLKKIQRHELIQLCKVECIQNANLIIRDDSEEIFLKKIKKQIVVHSCYTDRCTQCRKKSSSFIRFYKKTRFIFFQSADPNIFIKDLPDQLTIDNEDFKFLCSTVYTSRHFISIFKINEIFYKVDDLDKSLVALDEKISSAYFKKPTTVSLYYKD